MNRHWTLDELTDRLYGIREADRHLESCQECGERLEELNRRRAGMSVVPEVWPAQLAAQRAAVRQRIQSPPPRIPHWIPAGTAAACLLAVAVFVHRPLSMAPPHSDTKAVVTGTAAGDAELFADIYNLEESAEPLAAAPMHGLFEDGQQ